MEALDAAILAAIFLGVAALYASVGHGGASGYLAAMALVGTATPLLRPIALSLNVLVSGTATAAFAGAGHFSWRLFLPFAIGAVPAAAIGGSLSLPPHLLRGAIGAVLLVSAWRLALPERPSAEARGATPPPVALSVAIGILLGLVAGLTGTGGGILLSPLLLLARWADAKRTAATSAAFVLVNSLAGLAGLVAGGGGVPEDLARWWWLWALAALAGGVVGSRLGARRLPSPILKRLLALVLVVAGAKLVAG